MYESKYTITETSNGFTVTGRDRNPVSVQLTPVYFVLEDEQYSPARLGLYEYYKLSRSIAQRLMFNWEPPEDKRINSDGESIFTHPNITRWAIKQTAGAIGKRVYTQWKRLLGLIDPQVLTAQRAVFAATMGAGGLVTWEGFYQDSWVVSDVIKYRAAAIAASELGGLAGKALGARVLESSEARRLRELAASLGINIEISAQPKELTGEVALELMHNWRGLFSPTGETYHSLDRTLMNLPGGIPHQLVCCLNHLNLPRPLTSKLELALVTSPYSANSPFIGDPVNMHIYLHATSEQIAESMRRLAAHTRNQLKPTRTRDIIFLAQFLGDYKHEHRGNLVGLTDKAIEWHKDQQKEEITRILDNLGGDRTAARPPIPLPNIQGITLLDTVQAICEEGSHMGHCIASYARDAARGNCYLFHVEKDGESASVQVSYEGRVVQAHGPRNKDNKVAAWGRKILRCWGNSFPLPAD